MIPAVAGGGAVDVAFLGGTAYVIVTGVEPELGGQPGAVDGLYRVNPDGSTSVIADIGAWSIAHPPQTAFDLATGFLYAMQPFHDGFLVTDGHHNRVLRVRLNGEISEVVALANVVPTGLETSGHKVYFAEAGPVPHIPETGRVLALNVRTHQATPLASGARLAVDVELGPKHTLYVLSQGVWDWPNIPVNAGLPASRTPGSCSESTGTVTWSLSSRGWIDDFGRIHQGHRFHRHPDGQGHRGRPRLAPPPGAPLTCAVNIGQAREASRFSGLLEPDRELPNALDCARSSRFVRRCVTAVHL